MMFRLSLGLIGFAAIALSMAAASQSEKIERIAQQRGFEISAKWVFAFRLVLFCLGGVLLGSAIVG